VFDLYKNYFRSFVFEAIGIHRIGTVSNLFLEPTSNDDLRVMFKVSCSRKQELALKESESFHQEILR
jgi:hypothetical protein